MKFSKKLLFVLKSQMFSAFLVEYNVRLTGIKLKRYWGCSLFKTLYKRQSFLYQRRTRRDSKTTSPYIFSIEEPLIVPVKGRQALYWIDFSFSWKELLQVWSYRISPLSRCALTKDLCMAINLDLDNKF